jgi:hypothetical protein
VHEGLHDDERNIAAKKVKFLKMSENSSKDKNFDVFC